MFNNLFRRGSTSPEGNGRKKDMTPKDMAPDQNRETRRQRSRVRYSQYRDSKGPVYLGRVRMWEWKSTQSHPGHRRAVNRRRNKAAAKSRATNR